MEVQTDALLMSRKDINISSGKCTNFLACTWPVSMVGIQDSINHVTQPTSRTSTTVAVACKPFVTAVRRRSPLKPAAECSSAISGPFINKIYSISRPAGHPQAQVEHEPDSSTGLSSSHAYSPPQPRARTPRPSAHLFAQNRKRRATTQLLTLAAHPPPSISLCTLSAPSVSSIGASFTCMNLDFCTSKAAIGCAI